MERIREYPELEASFELPEKVTVQTDLRFWAGWRQSDDYGDYVIIKRWELIVRLGLLNNWECPYFENPKQPLDEIEDGRVADLIVKVVADVVQYMKGLRAVPKN